MRINFWLRLECGSDFQDSANTEKFKLREILFATDYFNSRGIGRGDFGTVYKAVLENGSAVAVKKLHENSVIRLSEFWNEVAQLMSLDHDNLVQLLGWSAERGRQLLIYEFVENNSLQHALFDNAESGPKLTWRIRYRICLQIAKGLVYLHETSDPKIIHGDIKASNILLDSNLNAKISDFGLAKFAVQHRTHGYRAPEYALRGILSEKTDVYSFGVVMLEIVSGKSNAEFRENQHFKAYVLQKEGYLLENLVDGNVKCMEDYIAKEAARILKLALLCTDGNPTLRPTMPEVLSVLEGSLFLSSTSRQAILMEPLTNAVVQGLYTSLVSEGLNLLGFKSEFEKMKTKVGGMTSFLSDAQPLEKDHENYSTVKTIIAELRDLVYDADDILLKCRIRAVYEEVFVHGYTLSAWLFRRNARYIINEINQRIEDMEKELRSYLKAMNQMSRTSSDGSSRNGRRTSHSLTQSRIVGLEEDTATIIRWITTDEKKHRVGIVGMGGLGKTTLAQKIFNNKDVVLKFHRRIWLSVSQTSSEKEIMMTMLKRLGGEASVHENDEMSQIQQCLINKNYLIVFDDVWSSDDDWWDQIFGYLPEGDGYNSSVIITTRDKNVATKMGVQENHIHQSRSLTDTDSWSLFCDVAFSENNNKSKDPEFEKVGKEIVKKCEGLPLAIKTIGGLLSSKTISLHFWEEINKDFRNKLADKTQVLPTLQLSYDDLPPKLQNCILCFSIYPEDHEIRAEQLVYWWVGEGFVHGNNCNTAIEVAFECLSELVNRGLVEVVNQRNYDGRVYACKMHSMMRGLIIRIAKKEGFCSFGLRNRHILNVESRRVGFTSEMDERLLENSSRLRAFLLMGNLSFPSHQYAGLITVKSLRVLDLSHNKLDSNCVEYLLSRIKSQKCLAYLNLHGVDSIVELPRWIKKHQNLQILVLTECTNLQSLHPSVTLLQNLLILDIGDCPNLQCLPRGLGKLSKLQVLSGFKLAAPGKCGASLGDLKDLKKLRVLRINLSKKDKIADDEADFLSSLHQLKVLSIDTKDWEKKQVLQLDKLSPPPNLQELYLKSYSGEVTPNWVTPAFLPNLLYLYIDNSQLMSVGRSFWDCSGSPWKIEGLCLKLLPKLDMDWETVHCKMRYLRYLEVSHCYNLRSFPCDVQNYGVWPEKQEE